MSIRWLMVSIPRWSSLYRCGRFPSSTITRIDHLSPIRLNTSVAGHRSYSSTGTGPGSGALTMEGTSVCVPDMKLPPCAIGRGS